MGRRERPPACNNLQPQSKKENFDKMRTTAEKEVPAQQTNNRQERQEYVTPECNIFETKDGYVLEAEMPRVNKSGLEVTLENNELTIVGHRSQENFPAQAIFRERHYADY